MKTMYVLSLLFTMASICLALFFTATQHTSYLGIVGCVDHLIDNYIDTQSLQEKEREAVEAAQHWIKIADKGRFNRIRLLTVVSQSSFGALSIFLLANTIAWYKKKQQQ